MAIQLDHVIVPSRQRVASAKLLAELLGVPWEASRGEFTPVYVSDSLTLDFDDRDSFESHHYAFFISDDEFDAILGRVKAAGRKWGSGPRSHEDGQINTRRGGRGFYFADLDGHLLEVMTTPER